MIDDEKEVYKFGFEKLDVYRRSIEFSNDIIDLAKKFPRTEQYGLISQIKRASSSISLNLAEGGGRHHKREKKQYYRIARESAYECIPILTIALKQEIITQKEYDDFYNECFEISCMISGLIKSVDKKN